MLPNRTEIDSTVVDYRFRPKPRAFFGHHCLVFSEHNENEVVQRSQVACVGLVAPVIDFVVDRRKKMICPEVALIITRITVILCLYLNESKESAFK